MGWNSGRNPLPFVLVEDVADAIFRAARAEDRSELLQSGRRRSADCPRVHRCAGRGMAATAEIPSPSRSICCWPAGIREISHQTRHLPPRGTADPVRLRPRCSLPRPSTVAMRSATSVGRPTPIRCGSANARSWCMPAEPIAARAPLLLHVFSTFAVGGPQMRFVTLANAFGERYRHIVMAMDGDHACAARLAPGLDVRCEPIERQKGQRLAMSDDSAARCARSHPTYW